MIGSTEEDVLLLQELDDNVHINIRHTKDFQFVTVNTFSVASSKVSLLMLMSCDMQKVKANLASPCS